MVGILHNKRISYTASIGLSELPKQSREIYRELLGNWNSISGREKSVVDIIEELIGKEVDIVLDPAF